MMLEKLEKAKIRLALAQEEVVAGELPVIGSMNEEVKRRWQKMREEREEAANSVVNTPKEKQTARENFQRELFEVTLQEIRA